MMSWFTKFWHKTFATKTPWAEEVMGADGQLTVLDHNPAYAAQLRGRLPEDIVTTSMTDSEVVKLWVERRNHEMQEPKLEVVHSDITPDGKVKLKLEWNDAFIRLLQNRGFQGESEDDLVQNYLHQVTKTADARMFNEETGDMPLAPPAEGDDIEAILDNTPPETLKALEKSIRRRAAQRGTKTRTLDRQ
jgi:hypothetical protein